MPDGAEDRQLSGARLRVLRDEFRPALAARQNSPPLRRSLRQGLGGPRPPLQSGEPLFRSGSPRGRRGPRRARARRAFFQLARPHRRPDGGRFHAPPVPGLPGRKLGRDRPRYALPDHRRQRFRQAHSGTFVALGRFHALRFQGRIAGLRRDPPLRRRCGFPGGCVALLARQLRAGGASLQHGRLARDLQLVAGPHAAQCAGPALGIVGTRWIPAAAHAGPGSVTLWLLAALLFMVPLAIAVSALSVKYPGAGGMYLWTRNDFGRWHGFLCFIVYWIGIAFWFPSAAMFYMSTGIYALGPSYAYLAASRLFLLAISLLAIWVALGTNLIGMKIGKWTENVGATATWLLGALLVAVAAVLFSPRRDPHHSVAQFLHRSEGVARAVDEQRGSPPLREETGARL